MPLSGVFPTTDGAVCMVGAFKENPLRDISVALEMDEDLSARPEFANLEQQFAHKHELREIFLAAFAENSTDHWVKRLESVDILCAPVRTLAEALQDEQTLVNQMIVEMEHPTAGRVRALEAPIHLSGTPATVRRVPPRLGEHNAEVLRDHGFSDVQIAGLTEAGVLR
jgi:crotonobetainyl-CoA:carnitine CoA-transferase CaiB-like acyl-CoA transferase